MLPPLLRLPDYLIASSAPPDEAACIHRALRRRQADGLRADFDRLGLLSAGVRLDDPAFDLDAPEGEAVIVSALYAALGATWGAIALNPEEWSALADLLGYSDNREAPALRPPHGERRVVEVVWCQGWTVRLVEIRPGATTRYRLAGPCADRVSALVGAVRWVAVRAASGVDGPADGPVVEVGQ